MARDTAPEDGRGRLLVLALYALAVLGGLLVTGAVPSGFVLGPWDVAYYEERPFAIPPQVYLYAYVGALASVFVSIVETPRPDAKTLAGILLRVPAGLLVVTGVYLLGAAYDVGFLPGGLQRLSELALTAYLVGLFVEPTLRALRTVSARLYPGTPDDLYGTDR